MRKYNVHWNQVRVVNRKGIQDAENLSQILPNPCKYGKVGIKMIVRAWVHAYMYVFLLIYANMSERVHICLPIVGGGGHTRFTNLQKVLRRT